MSLASDMAIIDLSPPTPPTLGLLAALPRRVSLTLPELQYVAARAGGAPLPFESLAPAERAALDHRLGQRLGQSRDSAENAAYATALASLRDPAMSLARRGLVAEAPDGAVDPGLVGAVGLLATPTVALDLDLVVNGAEGDLQAKAWHRQAGDAVASLATVDGIVFELAWFPVGQWSTELARVAVIPEDVRLRISAVPPHVDLPFDLADAANEAMVTSRSDLVAVLVGQHSRQVLDASGKPFDDARVASLLAGLTTESRGRLRVLVADVSGETTTVVGVVSWVLLADGWHTMRPHRVGDTHRVEVRRVDPADLAPELAPVLAEVTR